MKSSLLLILVLAFAACASSVNAEPRTAAERTVARGLAYANEVCANCHAVTPGQASPASEAPTFPDIANMPGLTETALEAWLRSDHPSMPNIIVERRNVHRLYAYLQTLKRDSGN